MSIPQLRGDTFMTCDQPPPYSQSMIIMRYMRLIFRVPIKTRPFPAGEIW